jgi:hypothetical protein
LRSAAARISASRACWGVVVVGGGVTMTFGPYVLVVAGSVVVGASGAVVLVAVDGFVAFDVLHDVETIATAMAATTSRVLMP